VSKLLHWFSSRGLRRLAVTVFLPAAFASVTLAAGDGGAVQFITLGTNSGPIPNPQRAEASNVIVQGNRAIVVDAGDAVAWQLAKAGVPLNRVHTVFLSHLHFDHTGGLFALLSQRFQISADGVVTIYGPEGTRRTVDALVNAMEAGIEDSGWILSKFQDTPAEKVKVVELTAGSTVTVDGIKVTVGKNSHYILAEKEGDKKVRALSFRFELPDRTIVYTGDTGPSEDVVKLAHGADMLVAEIMDAQVSLERIQEKAIQESPGLLNRVGITLASGVLKNHFEQQHLSPEEVGAMASRAKVKSLVITHNAIPDELLEEARERIGKQYTGPVTFASDLQVF